MIKILFPEITGRSYEFTYYIVFYNEIIIEKHENIELLMYCVPRGGKIFFSQIFTFLKYLNSTQVLETVDFFFGTIEHFIFRFTEVLQGKVLKIFCLMGCGEKNSVL